jgi:hypothetical protein
MSGYQGLGSYNREKPDPLARRDGESDEAHTRRIAPYLRHAEDVEETTWQTHRRLVDGTTASAISALDGANAPKDRAAAWGSLWAAGEQRVAPNGHLNWEANAGQPGCRRLYAADIQDQPGVSPLTAHMRSSGEGWL